MPRLVRGAFAVLALTGAVGGDLAPEEVGISLLQVQLRVSRGPNHLEGPLWSQKNGDARRTGSAAAAFGRAAASSQEAASVKDLSSPAWVVEEPGHGVLYQSPVLDAAGNVYMSSTTGRVFSVRLADGSLRWSRQLQNGSLNSPQIPTPVLVRGSLYTSDGAGRLFCLSTADGSELWRATYAEGKSGGDSWSMAGSEDVILLAGSPAPGSDSGSGAALYALSAVDGSTLWKVTFPRPVFNFMPAIAGDSVFFPDMEGGIYSVSLADGQIRWQSPSSRADSFTTGGLALGPEGLERAFVTSNAWRANCTANLLVGTNNPSNCGDGFLESFDLKTGKAVWSRTFPHFPANNAPAVFRRPDGGYTVVIGIGANPPSPIVNPVVDTLFPPKQPDRVLALDAETGADLWSFETPVPRSLGGAGSTPLKVCWPDTFSNAAVDANGTVYIGWHQGRLYALDGKTGEKLSEFNGGSAFQGSPALAPGAVVAAACNRLVAFRSKQ